MSFRTVACSLCGIIAATANSTHARGSESLFTIARSTNANIVKYDVQRNQKNQINLARPIAAYWLMLAENGRREELTWLEREFAYGYSVTDVSPSGFTLRLVAFKQREVRVLCTKAECRARTQIGASLATLKQIYVATDKGTPVPSVNYVELRGTTNDGVAVVERIKAP